MLAASSYQAWVSWWTLPYCCCKHVSKGNLCKPRSKTICFRGRHYWALSRQDPCHMHISHGNVLLAQLSPAELYMQSAYDVADGDLIWSFNRYLFYMHARWSHVTQVHLQRFLRRSSHSCCWKIFGPALEGGLPCLFVTKPLRK